MNTQLNPVIAHQRSAELRRAGEQARLAREVSAEDSIIVNFSGRGDKDVQLVADLLSE